MGQKNKCAAVSGAKRDNSVHIREIDSRKKISLARRRIEKRGRNFSLSLIKQAIARSAAKGKKRVAPEAKKDLKKRSMNIECEAEKSSSARERRRGRT